MSVTNGVPPRDREDAVLQFLLELGFPVPPKVIYRGMKIKKNITFSDSTVSNILARLLDDGYVMRCDKDALDAGNIEPVPEDAVDRRTYYYITEKGIDRIS